MAGWFFFHNYAIGFSSAIVGLVATDPCLPASSLKLCIEPDLDVDTLVCKIKLNLLSSCDNIDNLECYKLVYVNRYLSNLIGAKNMYFMYSIITMNKHVI